MYPAFSLTTLSSHANSQSSDLSVARLYSTHLEGSFRRFTVFFLRKKKYKNRSHPLPTITHSTAMEGKNMFYVQGEVDSLVTKKSCEVHG